MGKKGIIFSLSVGVSSRRELAVGFGELRVYIHVRAVGGSTVSTWESELSPKNISNFQLPAKIHFCQLCLLNTLSLFFFSLWRRYLFLYYLYSSLFLITESLYVHTSVLFFCNWEVFLNGKWFCLGCKEYSAICLFQSACPWAQWDHDFVLSHLVTFSSHQNRKIIILHEKIKVDVSLIITWE